MYTAGLLGLRNHSKLEAVIPIQKQARAETASWTGMLFITHAFLVHVCAVWTQAQPQNAATHGYSYFCLLVFQDLQGK